jgi:hypothetical protein
VDPAPPVEAPDGVRLAPPLHRELVQRPSELASQVGAAASARPRSHLRCDDPRARVRFAIVAAGSSITVLGNHLQLTIEADQESAPPRHLRIFRLPGFSTESASRSLSAKGSRSIVILTGTDELLRVSAAAHSVSVFPSDNRFCPAAPGNPLRTGAEEARVRRIVAAMALFLASVGVAGCFAPSGRSGGTVWDALAQCESGGNWSINTGNGYYGGLQFSLSTWQAYGGGQFSFWPQLATREQQIIIGQRTQAGQGWGAWPYCSSKLGLR